MISFCLLFRKKKVLDLNIAIPLVFEYDRAIRERMVRSHKRKRMGGKGVFK